MIRQAPMKKRVAAAACSACLLVSLPARADSEVDAAYNLAVGLPAGLLTASTAVPLVRNLVFVGAGERGSAGWVTYGLVSGTLVAGAGTVLTVGMRPSSRPNQQCTYDPATQTSPCVDVGGSTRVPAGDLFGLGIGMMVTGTISVVAAILAGTTGTPRPQAKRGIVPETASLRLSLPSASGAASFVLSMPAIRF